MRKLIASYRAFNAPHCFVTTRRRLVGFVGRKSAAFRRNRSTFFWQPQAHAAIVGHLHVCNIRRDEKRRRIL
jgi:hypothetical protein